jgi:hypothetical protein
MMHEEKYESDPELSNRKGASALVPARKRKQHCDMEDVASLRNEIKMMMDSLKEDRNTQNTKFHEAIEELRSQNMQIIKTNANIEKILEHTTSLYDNLQNKVDKISIEHNEAILKIEQLENQMEDMQRAQRITTLEVRNIGETDHGNLSNIMSKIHSALQIPFAPEYIKNIKQISNGQNKLIIVEYQTTQHSKSVLKALKAYNIMHKEDKFNTLNLDIAGEKKLVYISESLSPAARKLYYFARDLRKNYGYKYCWTGQGKVFVKKTDNSATIWIKTPKQIEDLKGMKGNQ